MKTLDEMLTQRTSMEFQEKLSSAMDVKQWTQENRDSKLVETESIISQIADQAVLFVQESIDKKVDGKSTLYWDVYTQMIGGQLELFLSLRDEMDNTPQEILETLPFDYNWITSQIRRLSGIIGSIQVSISKELSTDGVVEEI